MSLSGPKLAPDHSTLRSEWRDLLDMIRGSAERNPKKGVYLTDSKGGEEFRTYPQLLEGALRFGAGLGKRGVKSGDKVVLSLPSSFDFIEAFFGVIALGATPIPIAPPFDASTASRTDQAEFFVRFSDRMSAKVVVFRPSVQAAARPPVSGALEHVVDVAEIQSTVAIGAAPPRRVLPELAYIQITSGETSTRAAVRLSHRALLANLQAIGDALQVTPDDFGISWLPMFNTMGLAGGFLFNVYWGLDMALIDSERFMQKPDEWLMAISRHKGTLSVAPSFAYHYAVRRCQSSLIDKLDLSSWRVAMVGGDIVRRLHLESFETRFKSANFQAKYLPVYGLAEGVAGVTFGDLNGRLHVDFVSRAELELSDQAIKVAQRSDLTQKAEFVSVGKPLAGVDVCILGPDGQEVADRNLGEVHFRGHNAMMGYDESRSHVDRTSPGRKEWLGTGDTGYIADGRLYILGRMKTRLHVGGKNVFPEELELIAQTVDGVRNGAVVALALSGTPMLAYEAQDGADQEEVQAALKRRVETHFAREIHLLQLSPHSIPRSPSGKIRRHLCEEFLHRGVLDRRDRIEDFVGVRRLVLRTRHELTKLTKSISDRIRGIRPD